MSIKSVTAVGLLVTGLALGGWVIFLTTQGLDRADKWSSVVGAIVATVLGLAGIAIGVLSLRPGSDPESPAAATNPTPGHAAGTTQWNIASGGGTVFGVLDGDLHLHDKREARPRAADKEPD